MLKSISKSMKKDKRYILFGGVLTIIHSLFIVVCPLVTMYLLDEVVASNEISSLKVGILIFLVVFLLDPIIGVIKESYFVWFGERVTSNNKKNIFNKLINSKYVNYERLKNGNVLSLLTNDAKETGRYSANFYPAIIRDIAIIGGITVCMLSISISITIMVLAIFCVSYFINRLLEKYISRNSGKFQEKQDEYYTHVEQTMNAMISIKSYSQEESVEKANGVILDEVRKMCTKLNSVIVIINNLTVFAVVICQGIIYYFGINGVISGEFSIGRIMALIQYFQMITSPFYEIINLRVKYSVVKPMYGRIEKFEDIECEQKGEIRELKFDKIVFRDIGFKHMNSDYIFKNVDLTIPSKGVVAIIGESGSGKSTLCKLLLGLYEPVEGNILFDDFSMTEMSLATIRKNIAYVPQNPEILNDSFFNNINYCKSDISVEEIYDICKRVNLDARIANSEQGLNTIIEEKSDLSGGECARIGIARALLLHTPIIIMDEPFASLDRRNEEEISQIINEIGQERLVLLVTHKRVEKGLYAHILKVENQEIVEVEQ